MNDAIRELEMENLRLLSDLMKMGGLLKKVPRVALELEKGGFGPSIRKMYEDADWRSWKPANVYLGDRKHYPCEDTAIEHLKKKNVNSRRRVYKMCDALDRVRWYCVRLGYFNRAAYDDHEISNMIGNMEWIAREALVTE